MVVVVKHTIYILFPKSKWRGDEVLCSEGRFTCAIHGIHATPIMNLLVEQIEIDWPPTQEWIPLNNKNNERYPSHSLHETIMYCTDSHEII